MCAWKTSPRCVCGEVGSQQRYRARVDIRDASCGGECTHICTVASRQVCTFSGDPCKLRVTAAGAEFMFYFPTAAAVEEFCSLLLLLDPLKEVTDDCEFMYVDTRGLAPCE